MDQSLNKTFGHREIYNLAILQPYNLTTLQPYNLTTLQKQKDKKTKRQKDKKTKLNQENAITTSNKHKKYDLLNKTSLELRMVPSVTLNYQVTKIAMSSDQKSVSKEKMHFCNNTPK